MQHLTHLHEHHFLNDMGCMTGGEQPAFLAYSTFFNISAASGAKQKVQGVVTSFSTKKVLRDGEVKEEEKGTKASKWIEAKAWKGSKPCLA